MTQAIDDLYAAIRAVIHDATAGEHNQAFALLRRRLIDEPRRQAIDPQSLDVTDEWLASALTSENERWPALSRAARAALPQLRWQISYQNLPPSDGLASFQDDYSWAPLIHTNAEAPLQINNVLMGFTVQAPHITYPGHHHKPVEIYGILSGEVEWKVGDGDWELKRPGDVIVHRSHELHAMRTMTEPCLTWVAWDDHNADSVYMPVLDPPEHTMAPLSY